MPPRFIDLLLIVLSTALLCACSSANPTMSGGSSTPPAAPSISTAAAPNGAVIVSLIGPTTSASIYYTVDGVTRLLQSDRKCHLRRVRLPPTSTTKVVIRGNRIGL